MAEAVSEDVGGKLKAARTAFGLSQRELAKRAGVTNGMISLIEQGRVSPSVGSLQKILAAFPMTLAEFFTRDLSGPDDVVFRAADLPNMGAGPVEYRLVAAARRNRSMSILSEVYAPGADTGEDLLAHSGEEGGVVVEGELELTVAGKTWLLSAGDAYYFDSRLPHRFRNAGKEPAHLVSANTPPSI
ncbi:cupin domain-containing protein [Elongatibacter sediminis]|uniref:Cupin domain-containing protein n=1 Tax=Elongatibacter sediminis TaxID=3119006 RepID=A0AAW9RED8_9GAMM